MNRRRLLSSIAAAAFVLTATAAGPGAAEQRGTSEDAQALVAKAIELYKAKGAAEAFAIMNQGAATGFLKGDIYIFVFSTGSAAKVVVQAADQNRIGLDVASLKDSDGKLFGEAMLNGATPDGAWVDYKRLNPTTQMDEQKSSWVVLYGGYVFGCGVYKGS